MLNLYYVSISVCRGHLTIIIVLGCCRNSVIKGLVVELQSLVAKCCNIRKIVLRSLQILYMKKNIFVLRGGKVPFRGNFSSKW